MDTLPDKAHGEERLRLALEAAEMGYWEWRPQTNQIFWSDQTGLIFGLEPGEFKGDFDSFIELVHPDDRSTLRRKISEAIDQHTEYRPEYRIIRPNGEVRWLSSRGRAYSDKAGNVSVMLGVIRDITERKENEAERTRLIAQAQAARETAEAANRAKDEFIAQITHDLRSPLNAILGWTKVLRTRKVNEQITAEALATIEQSAEKQKHMIEDLLDVSRIITGKLRLDVRPVSLGKVIHSAMEVMRPACEAKGIDCETELATEADAITGDPTRLEQVIWNVVSNAVKFTPNNGKVKIKLERADPYIQITITDTGKGISPDSLPYIFNRYWQPAGAERQRTGGLGLGLSLTRHIVELHGGAVRAESEGEGKGTKIIITLPYRAVRLHNSGQQPATLSAQPIDIQVVNSQNTSPRSPALGGILAMIVDDEQDARELVAAILRQYGAEVILAASVAEALQIFNESARVPDLLVSDISMPEQDGYSLIRKVRALPFDKGGQIPAIALTAYGRMEDRIQALSAGFQMHVPKPVEPAELTLIAANLTGREIENVNFEDKR